MALLLWAALAASEPARAGATPTTDWSRGFVDVSVGLPPGDDINQASFGATPDELWVGTDAGRVYRSRDGGDTYQLVFEVPDVEPLVLPQLASERAVSVGDLGRGTETDVEPRDRSGRARRQADIAGNVRERPRSRGTPLLAALVRPASREPTVINKIKPCHGAIFVAAGSGLYRSRNDAASFERLDPGPLPAGGPVWVGCDTSRPGRMMIDGGEGLVLESHDLGESFARYRTPMPRPAPNFGADFDGEGRLIVFSGSITFREDAALRRFEPICALAGDSIGSEAMAWSWWLPSGRVYAVTADGVLTCKDERRTRLADPRLAGRIRFLWIDEPRLQHLYVATSRNLFESWDGGLTFRDIFTAPAQRSIVRVEQGETPDDLLIVTRGQLFRPAAALGPADPEVQATTERLLSRLPLADVVAAAVARLELGPDDLAGRRTDVRLRSLLPTVVARLVVGEGSAARSSLTDVGGAALSELQADQDDRRRQWAIFALWDLRDYLLDPLQTSTAWADVELLRREVSYRVQDNYTQWLRASARLADPALSPRARAYHLLVRRAAAAYLDAITGSAFAALREDLS